MDRDYGENFEPRPLLEQLYWAPPWFGAVERAYRNNHWGTGDYDTGLAIMEGAQDGIEAEYVSHEVPERCQNLPTKIQQMDRMKYHAAAIHARKVLPGAIGEFLAHELGWEADNSIYVATDSLLGRVIDQVLKMQVPTALPDLPSNID